MPPPNGSRTPLEFVTVGSEIARLDDFPVRIREAPRHSGRPLFLAVQAFPSGVPEART